VPLPRERRLSGARLPPGLGELSEPPEALYLRGELPRGPRVAIVGTRHPTRGAALFAFELAARLAQQGVAVLSGGADGIDSMAHRGALSVGGTTVVVAPGGFDRPFPEHNGALFRQVVEHGGAYLSLAPSGTPASRGAFFPRNACLVAFCHALVVVEAPLRSGARNAAAHARRLGRPVFVAPAAPYNGQGLGCILELKLGARPLYGERDVLDLLVAARLHAIPLSVGELDPERLARWARRARSVCLVKGRSGCRARAPACSPVPPCVCACARAPARAAADRSNSRRRKSSGQQAGGRSRRSVAARPVGLQVRQQMLGVTEDSAFGSDALRVLDAVRAGAICPDDVCSRTGLSVGRIQELLLTLTLRGVLVADLAGRLKLVTS
jgi:DNA processing protein